MTLSILEQVELAYRPSSRRAALVAAPLGSIIPVATYSHAHAVDYSVGLAGQAAAWLALGGLIYSGLTVFSWIRSALLVEARTWPERVGATAKALGFVVLVEGTLAYQHTPTAVSLTMLAILVTVNAIALQCTIVRDKQASKKKQLAEPQKRGKVKP